MINIGVIGAGRMGTAHAGNLATLRQVKLAGVCDVNGASAVLSLNDVVALFLQKIHKWFPKVLLILNN